MRALTTPILFSLCAAPHRNSYDAILVLLTVAVVLAAVAVGVIGARAGNHVLHEEERAKERERRRRARGRDGRFVENDRGLRLTTNRSSLSVGGDGGSLGESLLGDVAASDDSAEGGARVELEHERVRTLQLEGELSKARQQAQQALQQALQQAQQSHEEEKQRLRAELAQF